MVMSIFCRVCMCSNVRMHNIAGYGLVEIFEAMSGSKVPHNDVTVLALTASHNLTVTVLPHLEVGGHARTTSCQVKVEDKIVVKEEPAEEDEDLIDIEESRLVDVWKSELNIATDNCQVTEQYESNSFSESPYYICDICNKEHSSKQSLIRHLRTCNKRSKTFKQTISIHSGRKLYVCNTCNKSFTFSSVLRRHIKLIHTGEKPFVCDTCNKAFRLSSRLKQHMRLHAAEKSYLCNTCNKAFYQPVHLRKHKAIHTNEKPYVCTTCNKAFIRVENFKKHKVINSTEKPHVCYTCTKAFSRVDHLKRHKVIHTNEKPYVCNTCTKAFTRSEYLKRHMLAHTKKPLY